MTSRFTRAGLSSLLAISLIAGACGDSEEAAVTNLGDETSGSASSSASASATGISTEELAQDTENALLIEAVEGYRVYVEEQIGEMQAETLVFTELIREGDIEGAQAQYQVSRRPWERIEPIAGLIEDIDGLVDSRADDGLDPSSDEFTGWHKLEWFLWVEGDVTNAAPFADQLDADLQTLADSAGDLELPAGVLTVGAQELIEEVAAPDGKLSGEEERYSGTDLYAFQANVEGAEGLIDLLRPALEEADAELLASIDTKMAELYEQLFALGNYEDGYPHYDEVTDEQRDEFAATLGGLAEDLSELNGTLGLS